MYSRAHHNRIATILQSLDAELLERHGCLFGGGTAIVLAHNEYRESLDVDFVISNLNGYRELRQIISREGLEGITRPGLKLVTSRKVRLDQYGIRALIREGGIEVKFEIIHEGRVQIDTPLIEEKICGVATLTTIDMATTKLLANSDRWSDDSVHSRDIIDLAMLNLEKEELRRAISKAQAPYGDAVTRDLNRAILKLTERKGRLEECMEALQIDKVPKAVLWKKIKSLKS